MAYNDLQIQRVLRDVKASTRFSYQDIIDRYFANWESRFDDLLSSDPCSFPGFRLSIEGALNKELPPCGVVTGIGEFKGESRTRVGVVISNVQFQAGAFDMASAEKVIRLLVECAEQKPARYMLYFLRRHADKGRRWGAVFHGSSQRPHYQVRS